MGRTREPIAARNRSRVTSDQRLADARKCYEMLRAVRPVPPLDHRCIGRLLFVQATGPFPACPAPDPAACPDG